MDDQQKLSEEFQKYQKIAKDNPEVDVASLMMNALQARKENLVPAKAKKWAYLISVGVPPLGLLFAAYYYVGDKSDGRKVALTCVILTVVSFVVFWGMSKLLLAGLGDSLDQMEQIRIEDIRELTQ